MKQAVEKIISALVSDKEAVEVTETASEKSSVFQVRVAEGDMGRIIGREGRTVKADTQFAFSCWTKTK